MNTMTQTATNPLTKSLTDMLAAGCGKQHEAIYQMEDFIFRHRVAIEGFESASAELLSGKQWMCFHRPETPEHAKEFCRAVGGQWLKERDGDKVNYFLKEDTRTIHIFNAEQCAPEVLAL